MSLYKSNTSKENNNITLFDYVNFIKAGTNQDLVIQARRALQKEGKDAYDLIKVKSMCVTGSCTIMDHKSKTDSNISEMNGLIVIDIDEKLNQEQYDRIRNDKYTHVIHRSFSGDNYCVFIKINSEKFLDSFNCIAEYYFTNFDITIDQACKNRNRLRYLSYDPDIYVNEKSSKFIAKNVKRFKEVDRKKTNYIFHKDDFENILQHIQDRSIDLCDEDYFKYVSIGMSIASEFGMSGSDKFHLICSFGGKYDHDKAERDYKGFVKNSQGKVSIGTFYYYCKEVGIEIYTEKTKTIINRVKVSKSQGTPKLDQVISTLKVANNIDASEIDKDFIQRLIDDKNDYSQIANEDQSEIEQVERFILNSFAPSYDELAHKIYLSINGGKRKPMTDTEINDIYISCKKNFDFNVMKSDVVAILNSSAVPRFNIFTEFIKENKGDYKGYIDSYADCIDSGNEYNRWAFKKWLVGAVHNWTRPEHENLTCPLTAVLTGQQHGTGKTSFAKHIMPKELKPYFIEGKIDSSDKDSMFRMATSLMILDDEFGGKTVKDNKAFKALSDTNIITLRRPYGTGDMSYKRRAILIGTSNEMDILKDVTGNRRVLPIQVPVKIDYDRLITIDTTKMIVEAYNLLKSGFDWIIRTQDDIQYIKDNSAENEVILPMEEGFFKYFSLEPKTPFDQMVVFNQGEILEYMNQYSGLKLDKYDIRDIMIKNKFTYKNQRDSMGTQKKGMRFYLQVQNTKPSPDHKNDPF